jgi:hypothetical protein
VLLLNKYKNERIGALMFKLGVCQGSFEGSVTPQNFLEFNFDLRDTPQIKIDRPLVAMLTKLKLKG